MVEFFNPKLRPELEKNDSIIMKANDWKGAAPNGEYEITVFDNF